MPIYLEHVTSHFLLANRLPWCLHRLSVYFLKIVAVVVTTAERVQREK